MSTATINGLSVSINLPDAPKGDDSLINQLPPYHKITTLKNVADYQCPANWMNGSGKASSYFMQVEEGKHLWLDFNDLVHHTHEVAVVLSVQGINPVTNKPCSKLRLEQYRDKCPEHDVEFETDRYCPKCEHKWPAQNYMTTLTMPKGMFWIDGWHIGEGKIRGFLITAEAMRGVAAQIIGKKRVYAIGIAFFLSKNPKPPKPKTIYRERLIGSAGLSNPTQWVSKDPWFSPAGHQYDYYCDPNSKPKYTLNSLNKGDVSMGDTTTDMAVDMPIATAMAFSAQPSSHGRGMLRSAKITGADDFNESVAKIEKHVKEIKAAKMQNKVAEIAAGVQIAQNLDYIDLSEPDFYQSTPAGSIYLNYCLPDQYNEIISKPRTKRVSKNALSKLKVGNP